ncbi:UNVERIFIED_CONTAM: Transposon Ty3-G Gag-Pol polyprotein [Sesamum radiatum]|uniref:Transposon Ty3-G Gag-Pol polyprotein n=1 Tax=Sesamum radiatum TaxID=300843 RepID=A0AAW2J374_SESRA
MTDPARRNTSSDTSTEELSPALLRAIQHVVAAALREHVPIAAPPRIAPPLEADASDEEDEGEIPVPVPPAGKRRNVPLPEPQEVPPQWLARLEHLQKEVQYSCIGGTAATQEVKANAFSQGLLDGDFFKSLAKKPVSKFDALLARAAEYINMEEAQAAKKDSRGDKRKEIREEAPSKKPVVTSETENPPFQRVNAVHPLTVPITQALMVVKEKNLIARPRSWRDTPQRPKSDKFYRFHNDYGHTTEEYSGSSTDILFGEAYDQMQLGDVSLEKVNTSLYGFAGEVVHPRGMVSLPLTMGRGTTRKTCLLKFLVVDVPSAYNVILGQKWSVDEAPDQIPSSKKGKSPEGENSEETETSAKVQPAEELLNIEIIPGNPDKTTRIGSHLGEEAKKEITLCLERNADIFAWTPQDLEDIDLQAEVSKLMAAGYIEEIQYPEWLSNVVLVLKRGGKRRMCIDFRDLNKACPKDFYPLPRIDQLVDSTSGCELLSMMDVSQGYHQIMPALEDRKKLSFITSEGTFCYVAMPFGLKNAGATYQRLVDKNISPSNR